MAKRTYRIIFENKTDGEETKVKTTATSPSSEGATSSTEPSQASGNGALIKKATVMAGVRYARGIADSLYTHTLDKISLETGYESLQARRQFTYSVAKQGFDLIESAVAGGLIGGGPGAIIGVAVGVTHKAINLMQKQDMLEIQRGQEATQIFLNQIRMGAGLRREGKS